MYHVVQELIKPNRHPGLYAYSADMSLLARNLRHAALFRIRNYFTGSAKEKPTANELAVIEEVKLTMAATGRKRVGKVLSYRFLEKLMRVTENPDFFAGLPMQTAQQVVNEAVDDFKNWLKALRDYNKHPEKYYSKPKMPGYKKGSGHTFTITNQDAVLYVDRDVVTCKLPLTKETVRVKTVPAVKNVSEVQIKPHHGCFAILLTFETDNVPPRTDMPNVAAVDFGVSNIAAIVSTDSFCRIYKGGAMKACNQWFAKQRARLTGIITEGHEHTRASSAQLERVSLNHDNFNRDQCHRISTDIVAYCMEHKCGTLVLGVNKDWKQRAGMSKQNNQMFVSMPISRLRFMITYKAQAAGIVVIEQEESYTSKADCTSGDHIPVYGQAGAESAVFSGSRVKRGLYKTGSGLVINADCNGAANILRKAVPGAWDMVKDFAFLASPAVYGFNELNPSRNPVRRIAGV